MKRAGNIYLVGMMGAGKTTVGRLLARRLKLQFVDSDQEIESRCGVKVPLIFEIEGEAGFRAREAQVLAELTALEGIVLGTGGGRGGDQRTVSRSVTMRGVMNTSSSVLLLLVWLLRKRNPTNGRSPKNGILVMSVRSSCS